MLFTAVWIGLAGPPTTAQNSAPAWRKDAATTKPLAFEVVSIRPSKPGGDAGGGTLLLGFYMKGLSLLSTIMSAYFPMKLWSNDRLLGAPAWVLKENYDIQAKFDEATAEQFKGMTIAQRQEQIMPMLQALLAERCKLVLHRVPAETAAFALIVGKHGVNAKELKVTTSGERIPPGLMPLSYGGLMQPGHERTFFDTPLASLADVLSRSSSRPIIDQTGLAGKYDFTLYQAG